MNHKTFKDCNKPTYIVRDNKLIYSTPVSGNGKQNYYVRKLDKFIVSCFRDVFVGRNGYYIKEPMLRRLNLYLMKHPEWNYGVTETNILRLVRIIDPENKLHVSTCNNTNSY